MTDQLIQLLEYNWQVFNYFAPNFQETSFRRELSSFPSTRDLLVLCHLPALNIRSYLIQLLCHQ